MKKFTKFLTLLLAVLMCFCVGACDNSGGESTAVTYKENFPDDLDKSFLITDKSQFRYDVTDAGERSLILFEELRKVYYRDGMAFPWRAGYYDDRLSNSFLWDFGALHSMANAVLRANPDNETAKYWLGEISDDLETYYNRFDTERIADRSFWNKDLENNMFSEEFIDLAMRIMQIKGTVEADGKMRYRMPVRIYGSNTWHRPVLRRQRVGGNVFIRGGRTARQTRIYTESRGVHDVRSQRLGRRGGRRLALEREPRNQKHLLQRSGGYGLHDVL